MKRPTLYLQPRNGLCNRMRAIMYWSGFADVTGRDFCLLWQEGEGFETIPYEELFLLPKHWTCRADTEMKDALTEGLDLNTFFTSLGYPAEQSSPIRPPHDFLPGSLHGERDLGVSCSSPGPGSSDYQRFVPPQLRLSCLSHFLQPASKLGQRVAAITANYSPYTLGLHIRGNDALSTNNPNAHYYDSLLGTDKWHHAVATAPPEAKLFLATDSEEVEAEFRDRYPDRLIVQGGKTFYQTEQWEEKPGQKEALIDLLCLGQTNQVIGTSWSSYTNMAQDYQKLRKLQNPTQPSL